MSQYQTLLDELNARDARPLASFKRGEYVKIGSNGLQVVNKRKHFADVQQITINSLTGEYQRGWTLRLALDTLAIPLTPADFDARTALQLSDNPPQPFNILDGLKPALAAYLAAEKRLALE